MTLLTLLCSSSDGLLLSSSTSSCGLSSRVISIRFTSLSNPRHAYCTTDNVATLILLLSAVACFCDCSDDDDDDAVIIRLEYCLHKSRNLSNCSKVSSSTPSLTAPRVVLGHLDP